MSIGIQLMQDMSSQKLISEAQILSKIAYELPAAKIVVVLAPHPDDEIFGCGGALAKLKSLGTTISPVIVTDGSRGGEHSIGDTAVRQQESRLAAQVLGLNEPVFLGFQDRGLACDDALIDCLTEKITLLQPDLVFLPAPTELHPDHQAVSLAGCTALRRYGQARVVFYEVGYPLPNPNMLIDITPFAEKKQQAMNCFVSQLALQPYDKQIAGLNCFRSYFLGSLNVQYAEAFVYVEAVELDNGAEGVFAWPLAYRHAVTERDKLREIIAEWEIWIAELQRDAADRDRLVLKQNQRMAELENVIAQWDPWIARLQLDAAERDRLVLKQNQRIAELEGVIAQWDPWIAGLRQEIAERDQVIADQSKDIIALKKQL